MWSKIDYNEKWDNTWVSLLSRAAKEHSGLNWEKYHQFIYSRFIKSTGLALFMSHQAGLASGSSKLDKLHSRGFPSFYDYGEVR